jgi:hypothetical protein
MQAHPHFRLGRQEARRDARNFLFAELLRAAPRLPSQYDFDVAHPGVPLPMFGNDQYGDCVIAGRAHQTLRFELLEQQKVIPISLDDVVNEYFAQTGGEDDGLIVLDSLSLWRKKGWTAAGKHYKIRAFSEIRGQQRNAQTRAAIYLDVGVGLGLALPLSAQRQIDAGQAWDVVSGRGSAPGSWGGHYVYVCGYTLAGPVCVTWGRKQAMTWRFFAKYCDECYALFDAANTQTHKARSWLVLERLEELLAKVAAVH